MRAARNVFGKKTIKKKNKDTPVKSKWSGILQPDNQYCKLAYMDTDTAYLNMVGVSTVTLNTYKLNSAWDVNLTFGSSAMPGLTEMARFWNRYRVHACKIEFTVSNTYNIPLYMFIHAQATNTPGTLTTWANWRQMDGNRYSRFHLISAAGGGHDTYKLSLYVDLATFSGNKLGYRTDYDTSGYTNGVVAGADPAKVLRGYCGIMSGDGLTVGTGRVPVNVKITQYIEFFDKIDLVN